MLQQRWKLHDLSGTTKKVEISQNKMNSLDPSSQWANVKFKRNYKK